MTVREQNDGCFIRKRKKSSVSSAAAVRPAGLLRRGYNSHAPIDRQRCFAGSEGRERGGKSGVQCNNRTVDGRTSSLARSLARSDSGVQNKKSTATRETVTTTTTVCPRSIIAPSQQRREHGGVQQRQQAEFPLQKAISSVTDCGRARAGGGSVERKSDGRAFRQ